ncbi:hypothetical protein ACQR0V_12850 [Bradyrhizobium sp. HKCCYLS2058]|uniref:hypothetical protein n=1 Tax=Bradyrhizobium TaxID=374 RepID=UPI0029168C35|nr:hypothetical protein [Bradyrhizobium sp. SZCCHNR1015]
MSIKLIGSSLLVLAALQAPAFAEGTSASSQPGTQGAQASNQAQPLPQQIKQKLQKQGFTDINVVPGSFLVSAKDSNNDPVTMVIGPHSLTMFTEIDNQAQTTGSAAGASHDGSGSSSKANNSSK